MDNYTKEILEKIDSKKKLSEDELSYLVYECEVETEHGDNRRWSRTNTTIVELEGRYFSIDWEEGLTENQEDEFYEQPYEVSKKTYEKTITVTKWVKKENS